MRRDLRPICSPVKSEKMLIRLEKMASWYPSVRAMVSGSSASKGPIGTQISLPQTPTLSTLRRCCTSEVCTVFVRILVSEKVSQFCPKMSRFRHKVREKKMNFPATPHLAPVARRVAACGPICGLQGGKWGTGIPPGPFGSVLGRFSACREQSRRKGWGRARPHPGHFCPQCGQLSEGYHRGHSTALSVVGGVKNRKSPAVAGKIAGSQLHFREETANDK